MAVSADDLGRYPAEIETAVCFCCVEALQNATRHAPDRRCGSAWPIAGTARRRPGSVPAAIAGTGLPRMRDRLAAPGGSCRAGSSPGRGTTVAGRIVIPGTVPVASHMG